MIKTVDTIKPGDIFRTEYGDYGNFCEFIFVSCRPQDKGITEITVRSPRCAGEFNIYEFNPIDKVKFDVLGGD